MTISTVEDVCEFLMEHIAESGIAFSQWYVGIASKPRGRLFEHHKVSEMEGRWIYKNAGSEETARAVEALIIDQHGAQGGSGGVDESATYVYAYAITQDTIE